ncbi:ABC transporter ATP-binding protein [Billgrantia saliphila]|uniref:ABC transporter ATP-binding protein n=1 Tax=Billgrantia saliphila TaxID=1848458 RepID=UPI000CE37872|nr:ABC transporter ATP-binding protein [Halomonas saliphila]
MAELSLDGVGKRFGEHAAVSGLTLDVAPGEFVALLGPSGCGKTTVLRMLAGFEHPSEGRIRLGDRTLSDATCHVPPEERHMGMVFQSYALWPHMNVADNVGYPLKLRGVGGRDYRRRVDEALAMVQLAALAEHRPQELSGGQRQRVALARCLVASPSVVLLDEPLANLDRHLRATMEEGFRTFHRRSGATLVYVTHDQGEAMALADRIAVMREGRLVQWSTPETLYRQPRSEWLAGFIGQGSVLMLPGAAPGQWLQGEALMSAAGEAGPQGRGPVLIRPEHVRLGERGMRARVERAIFRGERYELGLRLADGSALLAHSSRRLVEGGVVGVTLELGWGLEPEAGTTGRD